MNLVHIVITAEPEHMVRMKQMEFAEKARIKSESNRKNSTIISLVLAGIGIIMMAVGVLTTAAMMLAPVGFILLVGAGVFRLVVLIVGLAIKEDDCGDKLKVPYITEYKKKNYATIRAIFAGVGFTNIECIPLNDLTIGLIKKPGMVETITVNGQEINHLCKKVPKDAAVIISYHSM